MCRPFSAIDYNYTKTTVPQVIIKIQYHSNLEMFIMVSIETKGMN